MGLLLLLAARGGGCRRGGGARRGGTRGARRGRRSGGCVRSAGPRRGCGFQKLLVCHPVALEDARQRELTELVSDHVLGDVHGDVLLAVVDGDRQPDEIREDGGAPRPGLDRALLVRGARRVDLFHQVVVHEWTLLDRASHGLALVPLLVPELDDHAARALVLARLVARGQHSAPADAPGLADRFQAVLLVADFADGGAAIHVYFADLAGTQAHLGVAALAREKLHRGARSASELRAGRKALGGDDIAAFAVGVTQQREVRASIGIVFQPLDLR